MCDEWANSFETFRKWALQNGYTHGLTIERTDNEKGYSPDNCIWADAKTQANNRRSCRVFTYKGRSQNLMEWCNELGLNYKLVHNRIHKLNWDFEKAITVPCNVNKRNRRKNGRIHE